MSRDLKVSVFIPTWNRCASLQACLEALTRQTYRNFEVIVIDRGSADGTTEILSQYSQYLSILCNTVKRGGLVQAANVGLQMSAGDVFTRTDDDVLPSPGWLQAIAESFASSERIGGVTGPTIIPEEYRQGRDIIRFNEKVKARSNVMWKLLAEVYHGYLMEGQPFAVSRFFKSGAFSLGSNYPECLQLRKSIEVDHLEACNWSARRELIERVGGFDEEYVGVGEYHEADIAYKIKRLGYQLIFNPKAKVEHCPSISGVFSARAQAFGRSRNLVLFYFRHIKPDTPDKLLRFLTYLLFYNGYWLFKFLTTGNANQLTGLVGTVVALFKFAPESRKQ